MTFTGGLQDKADKLRVAKQFKENPLSSLTPIIGEHQKCLEFYLDESCVRIRNVVELRQYLNYVKLKDISSKLNLTRNWFTIVVICKIEKKGRDLLYIVSDLKTCRYKVLIKFFASYRKHDVVVIANAFINSSEQCIIVDDLKHIKRVGTNMQIIKCYRADPSNKQCSVWVDSRNGTNCIYHAEQSYKEAGMGRAILKQTSVPMENMVPDSMKPIDDEDLRGVSSNDAEFVKAFVEAHPYSRAAKLRKATEIKKPVIGRGFKEGDEIDLEF